MQTTMSQNKCTYWSSVTWQSAPVEEAGMLRKVGVVLGGLAQDLANLAQLQLAVLAGVSPVEQLRRVAERLLLRRHGTLERQTDGKPVSLHRQAVRRSV